MDGGPADSETVVLLHGWPQTWYAWRKVMPGLAAAGYRVTAIEYRGAGDSTRPAGGYDKATMAADVHQLLDRRELDRVHLVGRDIGVMVAYALAAQWPAAVASLTMLDVPIPGTSAWEQAKTDPQTWHFGLHRQRDLAELLIGGREYDYLSASGSDARHQLRNPHRPADLGDPAPTHPASTPLAAQRRQASRR